MLIQYSSVLLRVNIRWNQIIRHLSICNGKSGIGKCILRKSRNAQGHWVRSPRLIVVRRSGMTLAFKTTFEEFTRVGPDNSPEGLTESSVGLVTDQPSNVYELLVTLL